MRAILTFATFLALAGCSIQDNNPDYEYPEGSEAKGPDWPELAVTSELESAGATVQSDAAENQTDADRLAARALALRARADRLRRQVGN
ncbi:hypothetical protein OAC63_05800 [Amylibacter sp.]|jgi:hypothetical protein|nr:hypothetical protein [Amylibacter sp.]MDB9857879.1 hypothetical protein [Amylibacter sp.]